MFERIFLVGEALKHQGEGEGEQGAQEDLEAGFVEAGVHGENANAFLKKVWHCGVVRGGGVAGRVLLWSGLEVGYPGLVSARHRKQFILLAVHF